MPLRAEGRSSRRSASRPRRERCRSRLSTRRSRPGLVRDAVPLGQAQQRRDRLFRTCWRRRQCRRWTWWAVGLRGLTSEVCQACWVSGVDGAERVSDRMDSSGLRRSDPSRHDAARAKPQFSGSDEFSAPTGSIPRQTNQPSGISRRPETCRAAVMQQCPARSFRCHRDGVIGPSGAAHGLPSPTGSALRTCR